MNKTFMMTLLASGMSLLGMSQEAQSAKKPTSARNTIEVSSVGEYIFGFSYRFNARQEDDLSGAKPETHYDKIHFATNGKQLTLSKDVHSFEYEGVALESPAKSDTTIDLDAPENEKYKTLVGTLMAEARTTVSEGRKKLSPTDTSGMIENSKSFAVGSKSDQAAKTIQRLLKR